MKYWVSAIFKKDFRILAFRLFNGYKSDYKLKQKDGASTKQNKINNSTLNNNSTL